MITYAASIVADLVKYSAKNIFWGTYYLVVGQPKSNELKLLEDQKKMLLTMQQQIERLQIRIQQIDHSNDKHQDNIYDLSSSWVMPPINID